MREFPVFGGLGVSEQYKNSAAFIFIIYVFTYINMSVSIIEVQLEPFSRRAPFTVALLPSLNFLFTCFHSLFTCLTAEMIQMNPNRAKG